MGQSAVPHANHHHRSDKWRRTKTKGKESLGEGEHIAAQKVFAPFVCHSRYTVWFALYVMEYSFFFVPMKPRWMWRNQHILSELGVNSSSFDGGQSYTFVVARCPKSTTTTAPQSPTQSDRESGLDNKIWCGMKYIQHPLNFHFWQRLTRNH